MVFSWDTEAEYIWKGTVEYFNLRTSMWQEAGGICTVNNFTYQIKGIISKCLSMYVLLYFYGGRNKEDEWDM